MVRNATETTDRLLVRGYLETHAIDGIRRSPGTVPAYAPARTDQHAGTGGP